MGTKCQSTTHHHRPRGTVRKSASAAWNGRWTMSCASKLSTVPANQLKHQSSKNYSGIKQKLWMRSYEHDYTSKLPSI